MDEPTNPMRLLRMGVSAAALLVLASCGGGGGGETSPPPTVAPPAITHTVSIVTSPAAGTTFLNTPLEAQFQWRFTSTGNASENYTMRSEPADAVVFTNASGSVSPGQTVASDLSYRCAAVGTSSVRIIVTITSSRTEASFSWSVECQEDPDPELVLDVKIYQGVLVGVMQAKLQGESWVVQPVEHTWENGEEEESGDHSISTNRGTVVEVDLLRNHAIDADMTLTFSPQSISDQARRILLTSVEEEHPDYDDIAFVRRVVYHVEEMGELDSAHIDIEIESTAQLPFLNNQNNRVRIDLSAMPSDDLPEIKFLIVPIRESARGVPEDIQEFIEQQAVALRDLLPVGVTTFRFGEELDLSHIEVVDSHVAIRELGSYRLEHAEDGEYVYGVMHRTGTVCGLAYQPGVLGVLSKSNGCESHVLAHEVGHNLSLKHPNEWPWADYIDGSIGTEDGWRLSMLLPRISDGRNIGNAMTNPSVGRIQFIPQQYYGIAKNHRLELEQRQNPSASIVASVEFEVADGNSFVFVGDATHRDEWSTTYTSVVEHEPFPQIRGAQGHTLRLIHVNSGTEIYRTSVRAHHLAHANATDTRTWSARIPAYRGSGLAIEVVDKRGRVVFMQDLDEIEL